MTDWEKVRYVVKVAAVYWLLVAGILALIYSLYRLSKLFANPATLGLLIVSLIMTAFVAWVASDAYKSKRQHEDWRAKWKAEQKK